MATLTIRQLDDRVRARLRERAAAHGRSMEAEVREILREAVDDHEDRSLASVFERFRSRTGGVELDIPPRTDRPRIPDFS